MTPCQEVLISWDLSKEGWWKLNTDGVAKGTLNIGSYGGVLKDFNRSWIVSFAANIGVAPAIEAKLWGIFYGLSVTWTIGVRRIIVSIEASSTLLHQDL